MNNSIKRGGANIGKHSIYPPEKIKDGDFDVVVLACTTGLDSVTGQLLDMGVMESQINASWLGVFVKSRILFLERLCELFEKSNISGSVAEAGVFQGEFAKEINRVFSSATLYLFDTFEGFSEQDVSFDRDRGLTGISAGFLGDAPVELVKSKLAHPEKCVFKKGYFPDTARDIQDMFCFVNLDFDLYNPTLAGLEFFYPRMVPGGVILIHDYFSASYRGVETAVRDFSGKIEGGLRLLPIGDDYSIAVMC